MDQIILKEETANLLRVQNQIDSIMAEYKEFAEKYEKELENYDIVNNSEERKAKQFYLDKKRYYGKLRDEYIGYRNEPYFGRMDLSCNNQQAETVLIGKSGINDDNKTIVFDWRSPVGGFFYLKTENQFQHNDYKYKLELRRSYLIKEGTLREYETEYDANRAILDDGREVTDPFLLKLLIEKRKEKALTDIIATIQDSQYTIIREPINKNFVVQGCAGSGKTMVLLHRLSYLLYNKQLKASDVKLITPNHNFVNHINNLSEGLGVGTIDKLTVDEFYLSLIESISANYKNMVYGKKGPTEILSDSVLDNGFLDVVYSEKYHNNLTTLYYNYWQRFMNEFAKRGYAKCLRGFGVNLPAKFEDSIATYELLKGAAERIRIRKSEERVKNPFMYKSYDNRMIDQEIEKLDTIITFIERYISFEGLYKFFLEQQIKSLYEEYNIRYEEKNKGYRHNILLNLELCTLYFGAQKNIRPFIIVDEAQDLSVFEYGLIKKALGYNCILNLYGDTNQNTYSYRGISDWNQIADILGGDCYILEQNYRNTNEITEYCNKQFNMNILSIGLTGDKVEIIDSCDYDMVASIAKKYKSQNPNDRVAIIYKEGNIKNELAVFFNEQNDSENSVSFKNISIVTVEMSKGIEYDAVLVITEGMTTNEKYVAYTRALSKLFVFNT